MKWKATYPVTVKKLTEEALKTGHIDLMISELKTYRRIAHSPRLISLMGFCQCDQADNLVLVFERIQCGSLFFVLHEMKHSLATSSNSAGMTSTINGGMDDTTGFLSPLMNSTHGGGARTVGTTILTSHATSNRRLARCISLVINICDALMFLHEHNIIHNYVNSHSIFITDMHTAKLGNLEYAVEKYLFL